jgi:hypothetical protein
MAKFCRAFIEVCAAAVEVRTASAESASGLGELSRKACSKPHAVDVVDDKPDDDALGSGHAFFVLPLCALAPLTEVDGTGDEEDNVSLV